MELTTIIEALLIASEKALTSDQLAKLIRAHIAELNEQQEPLTTALTELATTTTAEVDSAIEALSNSCLTSGRSFTILARKQGWKIFTRPEFAGFIRHLFPDHKPQPLSAPAIETLAIIAYRQPLTKAAVEAVRGVSCDGMIHKLLDKELISIAGRAELPGRPLLYQTTPTFFDYFGIQDIDDLPNAAELRSLPIPQPESATTVEKNSTDDIQNTTSSSDPPTTN